MQHPGARVLDQGRRVRRRRRQGDRRLARQHRAADRVLRRPDYCAGKLAVASDGGGKIARAFGLRASDVRRGATDTRGKEIDHGFTERTTFVVGRDGTILAAVGGVSPEANVAHALELVRKLSTAA